MDVSAAEVQRYRFAGELVHARRVVELCSGTGEGTQILRERGCAQLLSVDADPVRFLQEELDERWDAIVCLVDLTHRTDRDPLLEALARRADCGCAFVVSLPNAPASDAALAAFRRVPGTAVLLQAPAEGTLLRHAGAAPRLPVETELVLADRLEDEDAQQHVCVVGLADALAHTGAWASLRMTVAPAPIARLRSLEHANAELLSANARLGRALPGRSGAAAIGVVAEADRWRALAEEADARAATAEATRADADARVTAAEARAAEAETYAAELHARWSELRERRAIRVADRVGRLLPARLRRSRR